MASVLVASTTLAQDPADLPPPQGVDTTTGAGVTKPYWRTSGPARWFLASTVDLGIIHVRPRLALGYGKPHYRWFGAEIYSSISRSGPQVYAGIRGALSGIRVRVGARYEASVDQYFLPKQLVYEREELETQKNGQQRYVAGEAEMSGAVPFPGGNLLGVATLYILGGIPDGRAIVEESLRVVATPPMLWRARLGYLAHVGSRGSLAIGGAAEIIGIPERAARIVRVGPLMSLTLTQHLEAVGAVMIVASSPDSLGLRGAQLGQLGLRYRWATGDWFAAFP